MKTTISIAKPSEVETESLVVVVLDQSNSTEKDREPELKLAISDPTVQAVAADLLGSGELSGKPFETNLLHKPSNLKAKRLLLVSGGSAKKFSSYDLRRVAGTAVRALKVRGIRSFAFVAPPSIDIGQYFAIAQDSTVTFSFFDTANGKTYRNEITVVATCPPTTSDS